MAINKLIKELKDNEQDFEFYPTTKEMVKVIYNASEIGEWLDIGCGTCNFRKYFKELQQEDEKSYTKKEKIYQDSNFDRNLRPKESDKPKYFGNYYIIEKSKILLERLEKDVICLGTDFHNTFLIDKPTNNIFCNPPYSEYEEWTYRILSESNCKNIFLIIPERWKNSEKIKKTIEDNKLEYKILDNFDFLDAERSARAKVDIIHFYFKTNNKYNNLSDHNENAFEKWFDETFKMRDKKTLNEWDLEEEKRKKVKNKLINAEGSKAKLLVDLYNEEMETLFRHFQAISSLDVDILETIGITKKTVKEALKKKAQGAKMRYWKLAMDELEEITSRLTSETRNNMLERFKKLQTVDFTIENIYPLVLWVLKNANSYYDSQLIDFFKKLTCPENVKPYKSNQQAFEEGERWGGKRYFRNPKKISHYTLDYRIIMSSPFDVSYSGDLSIRYNTKEKLQDIFTIARNLGFNIGLCDMPTDFGEECTVLYEKSDKVFMKYRVYKNGNMHVKFDIEFSKAMNVEVSRLLGWIRSKEDIKKEFPTKMAQGAEKYFKQNYNCLNRNIMPLLTTSKSKKLEYSSNPDELVILINTPFAECLETILNYLDKLNNLDKSSNCLQKCIEILNSKKGFIYQNCLITRQENITKVEFRRKNDFEKFENKLKTA